MNILIIGDGHFTNRRPCKRKDVDYLRTMVNKLHAIVDIYYEYKCDRVIQVGDLFDSPNVSNEVIAAVLTEFKRFDTKVMCIYGQHDIYSHSASTIGKSPLAILEAADVITLLNEDGLLITNCGEQRVNVYGASFGKEIPTDIDRDAFNILVHHGMIGTADLFPGQNITKPDSFLREYDCYDLICCGDYHWFFDCKIHNRTILNSGCIVRKTVSDNDLTHHPGVYIFDTKTRVCSRILLNVDAIDSIFNLDKEDKHEIDVNLLELIDDIVKTKQVSISWKHILYEYVKEHNTPKNIIDLIENYIGESACQQS